MESKIQPPAPLTREALQQKVNKLACARRELETVKASLDAAFQRAVEEWKARVATDLEKALEGK